MPRPKFSKKLRAEVLAKTQGQCYHCKEALDTECARAWHVDHFPVRYADIEDQCGCCGLFVTDPLDLDNLVPSCAHCNTSHKYENTQYCGHSQPRIRKSAIWIGVGMAASGLAGSFASFLICHSGSIG